MGKKNKTVKKVESVKSVKKVEPVDITLRMLEDPRITGKHIELYNLVLKDFPTAQIENPIEILDSKTKALQTYNNYIKRTLETPGLTQDQMKKCLSNSYVRYYACTLGLES